MLMLKKTSGSSGKSPLKGRPCFISLPQGRTLSLGREKEKVDVYINDARSKRMISRTHAKVFHKDSNYQISAVGVNGVLVNNRKIETATLEHLDEVVFGGAGASTKVGDFVKNADSELVYVFIDGPTDGTRRKGAVRSVSSEDSMSKDEEDDVEEAGELGEETDPLAIAIQEPLGWHSRRELVMDSASSTPEYAVGIAKLQEDRPKTPARSNDSLYEHVSEEFVCTICQEFLVYTHVLQCSHMFCRACITNWLKTDQNTCPTCRREVEGAPVPIINLDNAINLIANNLLSEEDKREREDRLSAERLAPSRQASDSAPQALHQVGSPLNELIDLYYDMEVSAPSRQQWKVEYVSSDGLLCRHCQCAIPFGDLAWVEDNGSQFSYRAEQTYAHVRCMQPLAAQVSTSSMRHVQLRDQLLLREMGYNV